MMTEHGNERSGIPVGRQQPFDECGGDEFEEIDFLSIWATIQDCKWLITAIVFFSVLAGEVYCFIATPSYRADALIQIEQSSKTLATGLRELTSQFESEASTSAEIEILQSRTVLGKVVENLHLDIQAFPKYFPVVGAAVAQRYRGEDGSIAEPWFNLSNYAWGGEKIVVESLTVPDELVGAALLLEANGDGRFTVFDPSGNTLLSGKVGDRAQRDLDDDNSIQLFISLLNAHRGTQFVLRRISQLAATEDLQQRFSVAEKGSSGILRLTFVGDNPVTVERILNEIANAYLRQNVERHSEEAAKRLEFLEKQLPSIKERLEASELAFNLYRQKQGSVDLQMETKTLLDQIVSLESALRMLELKRAELRRKLMPSHPQILALDTEIAETRTTLESLNQKASELPATQQELLRYERDVKVDTELYIAQLNGLQELRVAKAGTVGTGRIIDYAVRPVGPESPRPAFVRALALIGGVFLGIVAVFVRNVFRNGVKDPEKVEEALGVPVYATVPHSHEQSRLVGKHWKRGHAREKHSKCLALIAHKAKDTPAVESLRSLRTALHFATLNAGRNSILITGPSPSVGKTFISANLCAVFAQSGKRVLLLDADMRLGHLDRYFGVNATQGLSDYICEDVDLDTVVRPTSVEHLDVIFAGTRPPNPAELLMHERFSSLLNELEKRYDLVLVDSPPVLAATDAVIVGQLAGATVMVVKSNEHSIRELRDAAKRLRQNGVNLRGVVLNDVPARPGSYGYGGYAYRYACKIPSP